MTAGKGRRARQPIAVPGVLILALGLTGLLPAGALHANDWPANAYVLQVDGLACPYCGYGVEKQFRRRAGVDGTRIDIEAGVIIVTVSGGTRFHDAELKEIVHESGFALGAILQRPAEDP